MRDSDSPRVLFGLGWFTSVVMATLAVACEDSSMAPLGRFDTKPDDGGGPRRDGGPVRDGGLGDAASDSGGDVEPREDASGETGDDAAVEPGLCRVSASFGTSLPVLGLAGVDSVLAFAIAADERSIAWAEDVGDDAPILRVAGRPSESVPFEAPVTVSPSDASFVNARGLSLNADGRILVLTNDLGTQLGQLTRAGRDEPFSSTVEVLPYSQITAAEEDGPMSAPVFGMQDRMLAVQRIRPSALRYSVYVSERTLLVDAWMTPSPRTEAVLEVRDSFAKTVTGISHDGLTFFVRDEFDGALFAVNRPNDGATFEPLYRRELEAARTAIPNAPCSRLYVLEGGRIYVRNIVVE